MNDLLVRFGVRQLIIVGKVITYWTQTLTALVSFLPSPR